MIEEGKELSPPKMAAMLDYEVEQRHYNDEVDDATVVHSTRIVWAVFLIITALLLWSYYAVVVEVTIGNGKVIPTSREQVIQSLEGGILAELNVKEGEIVERGQVLAQLNITKTKSNVEESKVRYQAVLAKVARLEAEVNDQDLIFPQELNSHPELIAAESMLYNTRREGLKHSLAGVNQLLELVNEELKVTESLVQMGAASNVELLRLKRQQGELRIKKNDIKSEYMITAREELAKADSEKASLSSIVRGRMDSLSRLTLRSPVRGIVKNIEVTTHGGIISPNGRLMQIVPLDDQLLVEAKILPRDIAFIYPGLPAKVKITAYDYTTYGDLNGKIITISPDTIQDQHDPDLYYYRVIIRMESDVLITDTGTRFPIVPGMVARVDIRTGEKTIFDYLMKPINQVSEALRER